MKTRPYLIFGACFLGLVSCVHSTALHCQKGQYLHVRRGIESCRPCQPGSYMSEELHKNHECRLCQVAEEFNYERVAKECTRTSDTVVLCDSRHYRVEYGADRQGECKICTVCGIGRARQRPFQRSPCGDYNDTVCTP